MGEGSIPEFVKVIITFCPASRSIYKNHPIDAVGIVVVVRPDTCRINTKSGKMLVIEYALLSSVKMDCAYIVRRTYVINEPDNRAHE